MNKGDYYIHGVHLFQNGDVLFNVEYYCLVKIDKFSNLVWLIDEPTHHALFLEDDGTIWVPSRRLVENPAQAFPHMRIPYYEDLLLRVSKDGEIIDRISMLEAIRTGGYDGILLEAHRDHPDYPETTTDDPTHLNDVEAIGKDFAQINDFANEGDILVSFRTIDSIGIIDRKSKALKWSLTGLFLRQHDPDALDDGTISIFDNRMDIERYYIGKYSTEPQSFGYSRILRINPGTQRAVWIYEGSIERPFYTSVMGKHQMLENGNCLIVDSEGGRIFELDTRDNSIVWEFRNILKGLEVENSLGRITEAIRMPISEVCFLESAKK